MARLISKVLCHYRYDATDRLVGHLESEAFERRLFYCGPRQVTEMQGPSNRTNISHGELLLAQYSTENGKRNTALLTIDQQSSVINALQSQKPPSPISYTPYGYRTIGSDITSLPGFTGERSDPVTHHYSLGNGHRWFNPVLMRFNSPDSLSPFDRGGLNPYAYCLGDPVNRADPSGQSPIFNILAAPTKSRITQFKNGVLTNVQPVNNVKQIAPGISIYDDTYKTGNRLNIVAHGQAPDPKNGIPSGMLYSNDDAITPQQLYDLLKTNNVNMEKYNSVRFLVCHLADGNIPFGDQFATLTDKLVKAYSGTLNLRFWTGSNVGALSPSEIMIGLNKGLHYEPRYFYPSKTSHRIRDPKP